LLHSKLRSAIWLTLATILEQEVTTIIGAPRYGRTPNRRDQRNGHYTRDLVTTVELAEDPPTPRTRGGFRTQLFPCGIYAARLGPRAQRGSCSADSHTLDAGSRVGAANPQPGWAGRLGFKGKDRQQPE
jgi:hypothetical protein